MGLISLSLGIINAYIDEILPNDDESNNNDKKDNKENDIDNTDDNRLVVDFSKLLGIIDEFEFKKNKFNCDKFHHLIAIE